MTEPTYGYGRARPQPPDAPTRRMPAQQPEPQPQRQRSSPKVAAGKLWAGGIGTAVVVALVVVVGIMLVRGILKIAVLSAQGEGAYGTASTTTYAFSGAVIAIIATALLHVLLLVMPRPLQFFYWICALITAAAVLLPFTISANLEAQIATAAINLVAGICLMSVLGSIGASAWQPDRRTQSW